MKVAVIGQGYVGLPLAMAAANAGHTVVGFDTDERKIDGLASGQSHVEDVPAAEVSRHTLTGNYLATSRAGIIAGFDVAVITVPTPLDADGKPDLSFVRTAAQIVGEHLQEGATVVLESTVAVGTTEEVVLPILEKASELSGAVDFYLGFSPERIDPGNQRWNFRTTPKVVSGKTEDALDMVDGFYSSLGCTTVRVSEIASAELAKLIENTFRMVNIAFANELARHARALGVNVWEAIDAAASKPFGFMPFYPGPGVGGHCLPIDPIYLAEQVLTESDKPFELIELAHRINTEQPAHVVDTLRRGMQSQAFTRLQGSRVVVLGYTYKAGTSDLRETPAQAVVDLLIKFGASVHVFEPHADAPRTDVQWTQDVPGRSQLDTADAVLILTPHTEFDYELVAQRARYVLDTRNAVGASGARHIEKV